LGDIAVAIGPQIKQLYTLQHPFVQTLIQACMRSDSANAREIASWVQQVRSLVVFSFFTFTFVFLHPLFFFPQTLSKL
jgi:hypothetical protein